MRTALTRRHRTPVIKRWNLPPPSHACQVLEAGDCAVSKVGPAVPHRAERLLLYTRCRWVWTLNSNLRHRAYRGALNIVERRSSLSDYISRTFRGDRQQV